MTFRTFGALLSVTLLTAGFAGAKNPPDEERQKIRKMAASTLTDLYKLEPAAQAAVQKSAGYAVFNNMGTNLLLLSTARGAGVAINTKTKQETFMKMISAGAGFGMGVKDYRVIFVFETDQALANFLNSGWAGSAETDAAAKAKGSGGAYSGAAMVAQGVWVYQITKNGLALQLTLQGTKYSKNDDLNKP
ncbi:MAG TPA: YSC84-related protein [Bryobacteraceae bacterium]|nr:YSC84-related protein [Bryobacteraceae bacterium]